MMTKIEFNEILKFLYDGAMEALKKDKYVAPFAFIATEQKYNNPKFALGALALDFVSDTAKNKSLSTLKMIARNNNAVGVFIVTEGWIAKTKDGEYDGIRPSKRSDKEEAVIISGKTPITGGFISQIFVKKGDDITLGEKTETFGGDGSKIVDNLLSNIWEPTC
jgi:hypothetical protein